MFNIGLGKIELKLDKLHYAPSEEVTGKVILELEKPVLARGVRVDFFGVMGAVEADEIGEDVNEVMVELESGEKEYVSKEYEFKIRIPSDLELENEEGGLTKWYVKATLDKPGLDLNSEVEIDVSNKPPGTTEWE